MRRYLHLLAAFFALSITIGGAPVRVGDKAPGFNLSRTIPASAAPFDLEKSRGKVVVLDFWATWCGPCVASIPHWNEVVLACKDQPVQFLSITDENEQVVSAFLKKRPIQSPIGLDENVTPIRDLYGVDGIPTTMIINKDGVVVAMVHPEHLRPEHIIEVVQSGKSSLSSPVQSQREGLDGFERVSSVKPLFEISIRKSPPRADGHGYNVWDYQAGSSDANGKYATVQSAILRLFDVRESLLDLRASLPKDEYDFTIRLPEGPKSLHEETFRQLFLTTFGLRVHRETVERDVYILTVASTNGPGMVPSRSESRGGGGEERGGLKLGRASVRALAGYFEKWLGKPVIDETGLTNRYDVRFRWKLNPAELLIDSFDRPVFMALLSNKPKHFAELTAEQRRLFEAVQGTKSENELQEFPAETRKDILLLRRELAKPEDDRFLPDPSAVLSAMREQLGLSATMSRRKMEKVIVERAAPDQAASSK